MVSLILDTDLSSDIDDAGDIAVCATYHRMGFLDLIGVVIDTTASKAAGAAEAILSSRGMAGLPIGTYQPGSAFNPGNPAVQNNYTDWIYDNYPHSGVGLSASQPSSTTVYRQLLADADEPVTILLTGFMSALDALLDSAADGISPLTGVELVEEKVAALYSVTGIWPTGSEFNFTQAPAISNSCLAAWPTSVPLIFVGIEIGNAAGASGTTLTTALPVGDVVRAAYNRAGYTNGRTCWGQIGVVALAEDEGGFSRVRGTAAVNASTGANSFTAGAAGPHYYLTTLRADHLRNHIEQLLVAPTTDPAIPAWVTEAFVQLEVS